MANPQPPARPSKSVATLSAPARPQKIEHTPNKVQIPATFQSKKSHPEPQIVYKEPIQPPAKLQLPSIFQPNSKPGPQELKPSDNPALFRSNPRTGPSVPTDYSASIFWSQPRPDRDTDNSMFRSNPQPGPSTEYLPAAFSSQGKATQSIHQKSTNPDSFPTPKRPTVPESRDLSPIPKRPTVPDNDMHLLPSPKRKAHESFPNPKRPTVPDIKRPTVPESTDLSPIPKRPTVPDTRDLSPTPKRPTDQKLSPISPPSSPTPHRRGVPNQAQLAKVASTPLPGMLLSKKGLTHPWKYSTWHAENSQN